MKNAVIVILLLTTLAGGYYALSQYRIPLGEEGKLEPIVRGDLTLPINATGEVQPARRVVIKAEASGEVIAVYKQPNEWVDKGELMIRLEKDEEQRSVDRARQDLDRANARLRAAEVVLKQAQTVDPRNAQAAIDQIKASLALSKFRAEVVQEKPEAFHEEERLQRISVYENDLARLEAAKANLEAVKLAAEQAEYDREQAFAASETARSILADAERRLRKTDIEAPISGIVAIMEADVGEVIQGGKTTLTGGTVLAAILDVEKMLVRAEVDESDIARVREIAPEWARPGKEATVPVPEDFLAAAKKLEHLPKITVEAYRDEEFGGVIERIYPEPQVLSGVVTYQVDVVVTSSNKTLLMPKMRAEVEFTSEHVKNVLICPNEAIREGPNGELGVYIPPRAAGDPEAEPEFVPCTFGLSNGRFSEVKSGLEEQAKVFTKMPRKVKKKD